MTDGPFPETKELVAGFCMLQVKTKAEAIEWTKRFLSLVKDGSRRCASFTTRRRLKPPPVRLRGVALACIRPRAFERALSQVGPRFRCCGHLPIGGAHLTQSALRFPAQMRLAYDLPSGAPTPSADDGRRTGDQGHEQDNATVRDGDDGGRGADDARRLR